MKSLIVKIIKWIVMLGGVGVIVGSFLPFIGWELFGNSDYGSFWAFMDDVEEYIWVGIMIVALVISIITGLAFDASMKMRTSIWMIVAAIGGEIGFRYYVSEANEYFILRFGLGRFIMEGAYIVLIIAAFVALGVGVYYNYAIEHIRENEILNGSFRCPKCGKTISKDSKFCEACGFSLSILACPKCGARREMNAQFCKECGKSLPVIHITENENDSVSRTSEGYTKVLEQHIWDRLLIILTLMSLFAILTVVLSIFFPYAKTYGNTQDYLLGEGETIHRLIHAFSYEVSENLKLYLAIMGIAVVVSHVALVWFGKCIDLKASIVMVIAAVTGRVFLGMYKNELFECLRIESLWVKEGVGVRVLEMAYIVLVLSSVMALGMDIYNCFISKKEKAGITE